MLHEINFKKMSLNMENHNNSGNFDMNNEINK